MTLWCLTCSIQVLGSNPSRLQDYFLYKLVFLFVSTSQHQTTPSQPIPLRVQHLATVYQELMSARSNAHIAVTCSISAMQPASYANCEDVGQNLISRIHSTPSLHTMCCRGDTNGLLINTRHTWAVPMHLYPHKLIT